MIREQILKLQTYKMFEGEDTVYVERDDVLKLLEDCVSKAVYEQVAWERDVALEQLEQLGYSLGQEIRTDKDCISRADALKAIEEELLM